MYKLKIILIRYNFFYVVNNINGENMKDRYNLLVEKYSPKEDILQNAILTFVCGGLIGAFAEFLLRCYAFWFELPRKEAGIIVTLTFVVLASLLTALGIFDAWVSKLKCALIIPITGFAHSMTSAALEYRKEGFVLGIGANIFKLAGTVILYGIVSVYVFGLIRLLLIGG